MIFRFSVKESDFIMKIAKDKEVEYNHSKELYEKMIRTKEEMNELAKLFGVNHELTIVKSQELDLILNEYMACKCK